MITIGASADLRHALGRRPRGRRVGLVPTMGALHQGHLALVRAARATSDIVVATVFVNPRQFDDGDDLARYPRQESRDAELAEDAGVDVLYLPPADEVYRPDHATAIEIGGPALGFEGDYRPGHFGGVALVCLKFFCLVEPDVAYFGQKDAQQVAVVRQLVRDTNLGLEIAVVPTVRDPDGLALSSRNQRLSADERQRALAIHRALRAAVTAHREGRDPAEAARAELGGVELEYADVTRFDGQPTLVVAARVGATRLIDNVPLDRPALAGLG